jgi:hypothetical protein
MVFWKPSEKKINYDGFNKTVCKFTNGLEEPSKNVNFHKVLMKPSVTLGMVSLKPSPIKFQFSYSYIKATTVNFH